MFACQPYINFLGREISEVQRSMYIIHPQVLNPGLWRDSNLESRKACVRARVWEVGNTIQCVPGNLSIY